MRSRWLEAGRPKTMTKYFKATVEVVKTVIVEVSAESAAEAMLNAQERALVKFPDHQARNVRLDFVGEIDLHVGMRMVHALFGSGEVLEFERVSSPGRDHAGFRVKMKFDNGDVKDLASFALKPEALADRK
jgi:hypothetical protein